jgi:hypothetical protein
MDKKAEFYYNYEKETPAMTATDYASRRLAKSRADEIGIRNSEFVPTLTETFFGNAEYLHGSSFSIEKQRRNEYTYASHRAVELGKRRKLSSASERPDFLTMRG